MATSKEKQVKILLTTEDGRALFWRKAGQDTLLPESLADVWVAKFKPELFQALENGELVGVGRSQQRSFRIVKVEKVPVEE